MHLSWQLGFGRGVGVGDRSDVVGGALCESNANGRKVASQSLEPLHGGK